MGGQQPSLPEYYGRIGFTTEPLEAPPCHSKPLVSLRIQLSWILCGLCLFLGKLSREQSLRYIRTSAFAAGLWTHLVLTVFLCYPFLDASYPLTSWQFTLIPKGPKPLVNMCFSGYSYSTYPFCIKIVQERTKKHLH